MWAYFADIIFSPLHWIWDNIINRPFYGVTIWQIFFIGVCLSIFYRMFVIPTIGGQKFSFSSPGSGSSLSRVAHGKTFFKKSSMKKSSMKEEDL